MITYEWRRAQRRTIVRRAGSLLSLACLLLAIVFSALAPASPSARSAPAAAPCARDSRASFSSERDACAAIAGPAQDHCKRTMRTAAAPRAASQEEDMPVPVVAPAATALLALMAARRLGRPEHS
ncbi:hypothetical protein AB0I94_39240 [Streptomyces sp. NPDC050147]|uniref:hypothetical protein n=1 Tax=Streptomyces sp. NPDC050147 TaxID=3155513 RepID=UPI00342119AA